MSVEQQIKDFKENEPFLYRGMGEENREIFESYLAFIENGTISGLEGQALEEALIDFLAAIRNRSEINESIFSDKLRAVEEELRVFTHIHFHDFNELEATADINGIKEYITTGIIPFLEVEQGKYDQQDDMYGNIGETIQNFKNFLESINNHEGEFISRGSLPEEDRDNFYTIEDLINDVIRSYENARSASEIPERIEILRTESLELDDLLNRYSIDRDKIRDATAKDLEQNRLHLGYGIGDIVSNNERNNWITRQWEIAPGQTNTPDFQRFLQDLQRLSEKNNNGEYVIDNSEIISYGQSLSLGYEIPLVSKSIRGVSGMIDGFSGSETEWTGDLSFETFGYGNNIRSNIEDIFSANPSFYDSMLQEVIEKYNAESQENGGQSFNEVFLSPDRQKEQVILHVIEDFGAKTDTMLRDTFNLLQEALGNSDFLVPLPGLETPLDYYPGENSSSIEEQEALRRKNQDITTSLLFLQSLYREDSSNDSFPQLEFYTQTLFSTLWEIYTLGSFGSEDQAIQTVVDAAAIGVIVHRVLRTTTRLNSNRVDFGFRWDSTNPEFNRVRTEREDFREFLIRQERRRVPPRENIIKSIKDTHRNNIELSDTAYYSIMEDFYPEVGSNTFNRTVNRVRGMAGYITPFSGPLDALYRTAAPHIPSIQLRNDTNRYFLNAGRWVQMGWTPRARMLAAKENEIIRNLGDILSPDSIRKVNELFPQGEVQNGEINGENGNKLEELRKNLDVIFGIPTPLIFPRNDTLPYLQSKANSFITNGSSTDTIIAQISQLAGEGKDMENTYNRMSIKSDRVPETVITALNDRHLEGLDSTTDNGTIIRDLNTNAGGSGHTRGLNEAMADIADVVDNTKRGELFDKLIIVIKSDNVGSQLKALNTEIRLNGRAQLRNGGITSPTADLTTSPTDTTTRANGPEATPTGSLIDTSGRWANPDAQMIFEVNILQAGLNGVDIPQERLDTFLSNATDYTSLDELRLGLHSMGIALVPEDITNNNTLSELRVKAQEIESKDIILRSLIQREVTFSNLQIQTGPDGKISFTYDTKTRRIQVRATEISGGPFDNIQALTRSLQAENGGTAVAAWTDITIPRGLSRSIPDIEGIRNQSSQRLKILEFIRRFR